MLPASEPEVFEEMDGSQTTHEAIAETSLSMMMLFVGVALSTILGASVGFALQFLEMEMPLFLEEIALGALCAVSTAYCLGKFQDMPEGLLAKRLGPAAAYGSLVGFCLFGIWWSFEPDAGLTVVGAIAGLCAGIPIVVSFGLAGGESRPIGQLEFFNVLASMGLGLAIGIFMTFGSYRYGHYREGMSWLSVPGMASLLALAPTLFGGRITLAQMMEYMPVRNSYHRSSRWY